MAGLAAALAVDDRAAVEDGGFTAKNGIYREERKGREEQGILGAAISAYNGDYVNLGWGKMWETGRYPLPLFASFASFAVKPLPLRADR